MLPVRSNIFVDSATWRFSKLFIAGIGMTVAHTIPPPTMTSTATVAMRRLTSSHMGMLRQIYLIRRKKPRCATILCSEYCILFCRLSLRDASPRKMCDRYGNRIILVIKQYFFFYLHEGVEHSRDRFFVGAAAACCCAFHFARCIFENLDACALCGVDKPTAHLRNPHRRLLIGLKVQFFHCQTVGSVRFDKSCAFIGNLREPVGEFRLRGRLDTSRIQENFLSPRIFLHDGHAAASVSGVNRKHFHMQSITRTHRKTSIAAQISTVVH